MPLTHHWSTVHWARAADVSAVFSTGTPLSHYIPYLGTLFNRVLFLRARVVQLFTSQPIQGWRRPSWPGLPWWC